MPKIAYESQRISAPYLVVIDQAIDIIKEYAAQGFSLTLRQLYYQFVARGLLDNKQREYKRLGNIVSIGRRNGLIDWDSIVDRTRELKKNPHWSSPQDIVEACASQFNYDMWENQTYRPEVWIEKDALLGVIEGVCKRLEVPRFSCRGYSSDSEVWAAGHQRFRSYVLQGQTPIVFHLGDHDPSGIDMTRDIAKRLSLFAQGRVEVKRLALNMDQVRKYSPPPNPAKLTDTRSANYLVEYGSDSWELDALEPKVMSDLIESEVKAVRDEDAWDEMLDKRDTARTTLRNIALKWDDVQEFVNGDE